MTTKTTTSDCKHINGSSRYERQDGTPASDPRRAEWVQRCQDCGVRIDLPGGAQPYREPECEDPDTGYRFKLAQHSYGESHA